MAKTSWDQLDPSELARQQDRKLRRQIRFQLFPYSPFYRRVIEELQIQADGFMGVDDLQKLPLVDRQALSSNPEDFVLHPSRPLIQRWASGSQLTSIFFNKILKGIDYAESDLSNEYAPVHVLETTGTTGEPLPIKLSRRDVAVLATEGMRMLEVAGVRTGDVLLNLLEPSSAGGFWPVWLGAVALGAEQTAPGFLEPEQAAALAKKTHASVVVAIAEDALLLLEAAGESGLPALRQLVLGPGPLGPTLRKRLSESAGPQVRIVGTYGFAEGRTLWAECLQGSGSPDAGYHLSGDLQIFEIISPRERRTVKPGEPGEVVFTGLDHRGTALARYRPGDVAMGGLVPGRCRYCGRLVDRIIGPIRRAGNLIELQLGGEDLMAVDVETLADALAHPALQAWQVEVRKSEGDPRGPDELYVLFDPKGKKDPGQVAAELDRVFRTEIGFSPTQFVLSDRAKGGVVDLRPIPVEAGSVLVSAGWHEDSPRVRLWRTPNPEELGEAKPN